jgi:hypothetical protein
MYDLVIVIKLELSKQQLKEIIKEAIMEVMDERSYLEGGTTENLLHVEEASKLLNLARATVYEKTSQ